MLCRYNNRMVHASLTADASRPLVVLFEDNHCLAAAKPAGLPTQAPPGVPSLEAMVKAYWKESRRKPGNVYLGVPHRLDRPVSGVVLLARNSKAASRLAAEFQERRVRKLYWAIVDGEIEPSAGDWEDWVRKVPDQARAECVPPDAQGAKRAVLHYQVRGRRDCHSLLEIILETGRMHQIRVQAAARGRPICGDRLYGSAHHFGPEASDPRQQVIALHARSLTFRHPLSYAWMTITADPPEYWDLMPAITSIALENSP